jgi:hypothetical protein
MSKTEVDNLRYAAGRWIREMRLEDPTRAKRDDLLGAINNYLAAIGSVVRVQGSWFQASELLVKVDGRRPPRYGDLVATFVSGDNALAQNFATRLLAWSRNNGPELRNYTPEEQCLLVVVALAEVSRLYLDALAQFEDWMQEVLTAVNPRAVWLDYNQQFVPSLTARQDEAMAWGP